MHACLPTPPRLARSSNCHTSSDGPTASTVREGRSRLNGCSARRAESAGGIGLHKSRLGGEERGGGGGKVEEGAGGGDRLSRVARAGGRAVMARVAAGAPRPFPRPVLWHCLASGHQGVRAGKRGPDIPNTAR